MRKNKRLNVNKEDSYTDIFNGSEKQVTICHTTTCAANEDNNIRTNDP